MAAKFEPLKNCLYLRCKQMFYQVEEEDSAEREALEAREREMERLYGSADTTVYWCQSTQTGRGPDDRPVNKEECSCMSRKCFQGIESLT